MEKESDKPPDVYPTDPVEMQERVKDIIDRHLKSEQQLAIAFHRQHSWIVCVSDVLDSLSQKISTTLRKTTTSKR